MVNIVVVVAMSTNGTVSDAEGATGPPESVELYVRAGNDGECLGGCPVCQRFFMILLNKVGYRVCIHILFKSFY